MARQGWIAALLVGAVLVFAAWFWRYDIDGAPMSDTAVAFVLDRWTGEIQRCERSGCEVIDHNSN